MEKALHSFVQCNFDMHTSGGALGDEIKIKLAERRKLHLNLEKFSYTRWNATCPPCEREASAEIETFELHLYDGKFWVTVLMMSV